MTDSRISELSQLRWRCRRGMLELDILLNTFLDNKYAAINADERLLFEVLLDYPDQVLFDMLMGKMQASDEKIANMVELIRKAISL